MYLAIILAALLLTSAAYLVHQFLSRELEPDHDAPAEEAALPRRKAA